MMIIIIIINEEVVETWRELVKLKEGQSEWEEGRREVEKAREQVW